MQTKIKKSFKIFKMEMAELIEDIISIEESYIKRQKNKEITNYILKGNSSLLETEKNGIKAVIKDLGNIKTSNYTDIDDFAKAVKTCIANTVKTNQLPQSVLMLSERKLAKVLSYINED